MWLCPEVRDVLEQAKGIRPMEPGEGYLGTEEAKEGAQ